MRNEFVGSNPPEDDVARILKERDATFERDKKDAQDAKEVLADIRRDLKHPVPR